MTVSVTSSIIAGEDLVAGNFVRLEPSDSKIYKAKNDINSPSTADGCIGFVASNVTSGSYATVYHYGINADLSGLTAGTLYYMGLNGGVVSIYPSSGHIGQSYGNALTAASILFSPGEPFVI